LGLIEAGLLTDAHLVLKQQHQSTERILSV